MKKQLNLSIPRPCSEKWENFRPTKGGGFCSSCQKEVKDFSRMSNEQIMEFFTSPPPSVCGKFRPDQLKTYRLASSAVHSKTSWISATITGFIVLFFSKNAESQTKPQQLQIENHMQNEYGHQRSFISTPLTVSGVVASLEDGIPLPGVNVVQSGTTHRVVTDVDGKFSITLDTTQASRTLAFTFIGMKSLEYRVPSEHSIHDLVLKMEYELMTLGETVVGGVSATRRISFRRWWWHLKGIFY